MPSAHHPTRDPGNVKGVRTASDGGTAVRHRGTTRARAGGGSVVPDRSFRRLVILGDSISYGMCASEPRLEWNQVVANLIREFQDEELTVFNRGYFA